MAERVTIATLEDAILLRFDSERYGFAFVDVDGHRLDPMMVAVTDHGDFEYRESSVGVVTRPAYRPAPLNLRDEETP